MSILHLQTPDFLFALAAQQQPQWVEKPVALLGADERVWAMSGPARASGVQVGLTPHQARMRCADVGLHALDTHASDDAQAAFVGVLTQTGLTVEPQGYGAAYIDLKPVTTSPSDAQPVCAELGKQVRELLGMALQPSLGCDSGKFTARAAAAVSRPGRMKLVDQPDEVRFLTPLSITLLPLPMPALQQLHWLGIRTLGQFGQLPQTSVVQRFGKAGKLAHQWARGLDARPVRPSANATPEPISVDLDVPTTSHDLVVSATAHAIAPALHALTAQMEGFRRLRLVLHFVDHSTRSATQTFVEPIHTPEQTRSAIAQTLKSCAWLDELTALDVTLLDTTELCPQQLTLFDEFELGGDLALEKESASASPFARVFEQLGLRYSNSFFQAQLSDPTHPIPERRFAILSISY